MTSGNIKTKSTITTLATSVPNVSMAELTRTTASLPSPPGLKTESASWHSQLPTSTAAALDASATSAPALFFTNSFFEIGSYRVNDCVILDDLEQFVFDNTATTRSTMIMDDTDDAMDDSSPLLQGTMPRSTSSTVPDTSMLFYMDNNNNNDDDDDDDDDGDTGGEYQDFSFDADDFILIDHSYEPVSPPTSPFVLFPPL